MASLLSRFATPRLFGLSGIRSSRQVSKTPCRSLTIQPPFLSASIPTILYSGRHHGLKDSTASKWTEFNALDKQHKRDTSFRCEVTVAFGKFLQKAEQQYFLNLPIAHQRILGLENKPQWAPLACFSTHFEIILALSNMKPSVLFWAEADSGTERADASPVFNDYVETVVQPLFKIFGLEKYGYILQKISHDVIVNGRENWGGAWVLVDTRSAHWDVVRHVYFNAEDAEHQIPITGEALGLPVLSGLPGYDMRYTITNTTATLELSELVDEEVAPVVAMDYRGSSDAMQIDWSRKHFLLCQAIAALHNIQLKFEYHPWE